MIFLFVTGLWSVFSGKTIHSLETPPAPPGLKINFRVIYQNRPFVTNKKYELNGHTTMFTRLEFFISTIQLLSPQGDTTVKDIALLDFTSLDDSAKAGAGLTVDVGSIPAKSFTGVRFGIGVAAAQNAKRPADYPADSPLADASYYWDAWKGYIFSKLEAKIDADGSGRLNTGITLHTGGGEIYQTVAIHKNFQTGAPDGRQIQLVIDFAQVVKDLDFTVVNATHKKSDLPMMKKIITNLAGSIGAEK